MSYIHFISLDRVLYTPMDPGVKVSAPVRTEPTVMEWMVPVHAVQAGWDRQDICSLINQLIN